MEGINTRIATNLRGHFGCRNTLVAIERRELNGCRNFDPPRNRFYKLL
jgi:hypothetical protein